MLTNAEAALKLNTFKPRPYQLPMLKALDSGYKRVLAILPRRCLSPETHILLADGSYVEMKEVCAGMSVLSWDGEKFVPDTVEEVWETEAKETLVVKAGAYLPLVSSPDHRFATTATSPTVRWERIGQCGPNRSLLQYAGISSTHSDPKMARFWGYMLADGYVSGYQLPKFTNNNLQMVEEVEGLASELFGVTPIRRKKGNGWDVGLSNGTKGGGATPNPIKELFRQENLDRGKAARRLPKALWEYDEESLLLFFSALLSADGSIYTHREGFIAAKTNHEIPPGIEVVISCGLSKAYAWDLYWLLRKLGIVPQTPKCERESNWKIRVSKSRDVKTLLTYPVVGKEEARRVALQACGTKSTSRFKGCYRSRYKLANGEKTKLYDLRTRNHHNFVANGYLVHNSGKDVTALNYIIRKMYEAPGVYYYIFPTYSQAKKVIWDSITNDGFRMLDYFPEELVLQKNAQEMKIRMQTKDGQESLFQLIGSDNYDCYDDQTEILTENGWKLFKDLDRSNRVATLNRASNELEWQRPTAHMEYDFVGDLVCGVNSSIDFAVTPNHRFWVRSVKGRWKFKRADDPTIQGDLIPAQSGWRGREPGEILGYDPATFMCFLGLYISEGSTFRNAKNYRVHISQKKPDVRREIERILAAMGITYVVSPVGYSFNSKKLWEYLAPLGKQPERYIPSEILNLSRPYLHLLFEYLVLGAGHRCDVYTAYYSTSKHLIDQVQELVIKLGLSGNVHTKHKSGYTSFIRGRAVVARRDLYEVRLRRSQFKRLKGANSKQVLFRRAYEGKVYCVSVPNEVVKVRRNGKEMWSGNSLMGTNPRGCVFSEYALQDPMAYQYLRPILTANQGWALFISCVAPDTLILTPEGLQPICELSPSRKTYSRYDKPIYGLGGFHNAEHYYYGGRQHTKKITLASGFQIECTPIHPLWNGKEWVQAKQLRPGDLLPIQYDQQVFGDGSVFHSFPRRPHGLTESFIPLDFPPDLFYLLGLIQGNGSHTDSSVTIADSDAEVIDFIRDWGGRTYNRPHHHNICSTELVDFMKFVGMGRGARNKIFPRLLLQATQEQQRAFLQGWFDTDGTSHVNRGAVKLTSICEEAIRTLQVVLLNFGIVSSVHSEPSRSSLLGQKKIIGRHPCFNLEMDGYFAERFYEKIGFRLPRKQRNRLSLQPGTMEESGNVYPIDLSRLSGVILPKNIITNPNRISRRKIAWLALNRPHPYWDELLAEKLFYSPIKSIEESESEVFDFVIPETHSFFSNGLISHNTPRGKNHLWALKELAERSPDWFYYKLSVEETEHIPLSEIDRERREGLLSEDMIQQEYYTSFEMGVEGAFYAKYIDQAKREHRIGDVPHENGFKVHTAWDLGVRDSTCIIFFQVIGQTVRLIDYYENSKEGLEHYAQLIHSKPYIYGKHFAPHDIKVREFGSGITRLQKARELDVPFVLAPDVDLLDGIETVRSTFSKLCIDQTRCAPLVKALENYRQEWDNKRKVYSPRPLHDWSSHAADCVRYLCLSLPRTRDSDSPEQLEQRYREAIGHTPTHGPMFEQPNPYGHNARMW